MLSSSKVGKLIAKGLSAGVKQVALIGLAIGIMGVKALAEAAVLDWSFKGVEDG